MNSGIYTITSPSGRKYIGSAVDFDKRWSTHRYNLRRGTHHSLALQNAYNKYGADALTFRKLIVCARADLLLYEQRTIDAYRFAELYNIAPTAGSQLGFSHSMETKARLSHLRRGVKRPRTAEHTAKIAAARRGGKLSAAARANQSAAQKGRAKTAEHVQKVAAANRGKKRSAAVVAKMIAASANVLTARTTSGYVGVSRRGAKWQARVNQGGKRIYLGYFPTPEAANAAVQAALQNGAPPA